MEDQLMFEAILYVKDNIFDIDAYDPVIKLISLSAEELTTLTFLADRSDIHIACFPYPKPKED